MSHRRVPLRLTVAVLAAAFFTSGIWVYQALEESHETGAVACVENLIRIDQAKEQWAFET